MERDVRVPHDDKSRGAAETVEGASGVGHAARGQCLYLSHSLISKRREGLCSFFSCFRGVVSSEEQCAYLPIYASSAFG